MSNLKSPILILHGALGASDQFIPLAEELSENFDVYLFEFSGHGQTPFSTNGFSIEVFAEETAAFIETNFPQGVNVFGYSMGGYVGMYVCKNYPGAILSLCTLGTKWKWTEEIAQREVKMINAEKIQEKIPVFAGVLEKRHEAAGWKNLLQKTADMMLEMGKNSPLQPDMLNNINQRIEIMLGDTDEMVTQEETYEVYNALPNAGFTLLEGTKHPVEKVNTALLANLLRGFFDK